MHVEIYSSNLRLTDSIKEYIDIKLRHTLERVKSHVKSVSIRLTDVNGPRGGCDKRCLLAVSISNTQELIVYDTQTNIYHAIDNALNRLGRVVVGKIDRLKKRKKQVMKMIGKRQLIEHDRSPGSEQIRGNYFYGLQQKRNVDLSDEANYHDENVEMASVN